MRRALWLILLAFVLCACALPEPAAPTTPAPIITLSPASAVPTAAADPTSIPATVAPSPAAPTSAAAPTAVSPTAGATSTEAPVSATVAPTSVPATVAPTSVPAPAIAALPDAPLNPQDQAPALLPDSRGDLDRAGEWNRYTISAIIDPQQHTISGSERIAYTNRDSGALDKLYFHLYPNLPDFHGRLTIDALMIDGRASPIVYESRNYLLRVNLPQPLAPGSTTVVTLGFTTTAPKNVSDTFYGAFNEENGVLALASSYPIAAIIRKGRWDIGWPDSQGDFVNSETALYEATLTVPADWNLATTGVTVGQQQDGDHQTLHIVSGPQRDFVITANQLAHSSAEVDGTRINAYYLPADATGGQIVLNSSIQALRTFNARYGRYPLAELDVVEVAARTFLGVEYPGLVMIEHRLYARPDQLEITVAHEVSHQWWYSIVGNDVQTEAWLDEALASYSQVVYADAVYGNAAAEDQLNDFRQRYRTIMAAGRDSPVELPTSAFQQNYVSIVYGKAVLFFAVLHQRMGDAAFDHFLHDYYATHRYGYVTSTDLLASAEGACGCDLHELYRNWITTVTPVELP
jgi:hypothetical protein